MFRTGSGGEDTQARRLIEFRPLFEFESVSAEEEENSKRKEYSVPLPEVTSKVTVMGNCKGGEPCILDAGGTANHFTVGLSGYLTLKDIELRNGYCTHGGAVLVTGIGANQFGAGGKFVAFHVHFYNNTATINFKVDKMKVTPLVHGVLGQTYQETKHTYKKLHDARGKHGHRASEVLVDGKMEDYLTSDILAPDCKYTQFEGRKNVVQRIHRLLMSRAGVIFSSDIAREEISEVCTGFGHELDCGMNSELY
ncbi:hypothetical protein R1sor_018904 [Riccia sorocarpa]|uniref:Uncharacterized protein n=1 Tax=Riccia sorocarpa TaxID=122646 RepID=A0ABD3IDR9_9MARC